MYSGVPSNRPPPPIINFWKVLEDLRSRSSLLTHQVSLKLRNKFSAHED